MENKYIFASQRLGFRNWTIDDLPVFAEMNADQDVMEHFPNPLTNTESEAFMQRLQKHYAARGYTYFETEILETGEFIGFIGLAYQDYETDFTPATDIGWRLKKSAWGKGYATEGARRCLNYAFNELGLDSVVSTCTKQNRNSENVMKKLGMEKRGEFNHPKLSGYPELEKCVWYEIKKHSSV